MKIPRCWGVLTMSIDREMANQATCINEHYVSVADIQRTLHDECGINIDGAAKEAE